MASDDRKPPRSGSVQVTINVTRDESRPEFQEVPYALTLSENTAVASVVFTVTASDSDLQVSNLSKIQLLSYTLTLH